MPTQNLRRKTMPISNFASGTFCPEVVQKNTDKGRKLLIRYFYHIFQKKKYKFFIFSAGDWTTDKNKTADKPLIRPENH